MPQMTVGRMIELLSEFPEDATLNLMHQESWPFEYSISGVVSREEFMDEDEDGYETVHDCLKNAQGKERHDGANTTDVFIVEGSQLRYGSKEAWNVCRK